MHPVIKWSGSKRSQADEIKNNPKDIADKYEIMWTNLQVNGEKYYYIIRDLFNQEHKPEQLLFLSRTCINGLIRFNKKGKFNSPFHQISTSKN